MLTDLETINNKEDMAKLLYDCACLAGDYLTYLNVLFNPNCSELVDEAFAPIVCSLQQSLYVELYKLFDGGADVPSVYKLCKMLDDNTEQKSNYRKISPFNDMIENIRQRRSNIFAHNIYRNHAQKVFDDYPVERIDELLKVVAEICIEANDNLPKTHCHSNINKFTDLLSYIEMQINEANNQNYNDKMQYVLRDFLIKLQRM